MEASNAMARDKASYLVIESLEPSILSALRKPDLVRKFIEHLKGFYWSRSTISKLGSKPINDIAQRIKASELPLDAIGKLRQMFKVAYFDQSMILPSNWEVWTNLIARYHLYEICSFAERSKVIDSLSQFRINSPFDLANFSKMEISTLESA